MDYSQDVLLDWSYKHPGAPNEPEPIHREWFKERWSHDFHKKQNSQFLEILRRKHLEIVASKLLIYYGLGVAIFQSLGRDDRFIKPKHLIALGQKGYALIADEEKWREFLDSIPSNLDDLFL